MDTAAPEARPPYTYLRRGRWFWEPPPRLRKPGLKVQALGADQAVAWTAARALNAQLAASTAGPPPGSVRWLFDLFEQDDKFAGLRERTQRDYRWLARVLSAHEVGGIPLGTLPAASLRPRHADAIYSALAKVSGHATAHYACRYARRVWAFGFRKEAVKVNPWMGMALKVIPQRQQRWTWEQVTAFCAKAREMAWPSQALAVQLSFWLSHRLGDVLTLTHENIETKRRTTSKTGAPVSMVADAYPELAKALAQAEVDRAEAFDRRRALVEARGATLLVTARQPEVVICETTGVAWGRDHFSHVFRDIADAAGIPKGLQFRDLRATALTELADGDATLAQLRTHGAHTTAAMALRYARPTAEQFLGAAQRRLEHRAALEAGRRNSRRNVGTAGGGEG